MKHTYGDSLTINYLFKLVTSINISQKPYSSAGGKLTQHPPGTRERSQRAPSQCSVYSCVK